MATLTRLSIVVFWLLVALCVAKWLLAMWTGDHASTLWLAGAYCFRREAIAQKAWL